MIAVQALGEKGQGNRCGHDPDNPRWFEPPPKHKGRPRILQEIEARIREYYHRPDETLPGLNAANESDRQQRSERREACCSMLGAILHYTDLITLRVGIPQTDGSMAGIKMTALAELAGLAHYDEAGNVVCIRRAERAIADLKKAGIITVHALCEKLEDATYKGYAAIRTVSKHLFAALGLDRWLEHERRRARERQETRARKRARKALGNIRLATDRIVQAPPTPPPAQASTPEPKRKGGPRSAGEIAIANIKALLSGKPATSPSDPNHTG